MRKWQGRTEQAPRARIAYPECGPSITQQRQQQRLVLCLFDSPPEIKKNDELRRLLCLDQVLDRFGGVEQRTIGTDYTSEGREVVLKSEVVGAL